jgi:hypothetical protein
MYNRIGHYQISLVINEKYLQPQTNQSANKMIN